VPPYADDSISEENSSEEAVCSSGSTVTQHQGGQQGQQQRRLAAPDALHVELQAKQEQVDSYILNAARLAAPLLHEAGWAQGFDWCREQLNAAGYAALAGEVQLARANEHLARKQYAAAVALLKEFERSDSKQRAQAAVNLSTLHLLEAQLGAAGGYADYCCEVEPSGAAALVSRGNVHLAEGRAEEALQVGWVGWDGRWACTRAGRWACSWQEESRPAHSVLTGMH